MPKLSKAFKRSVDYKLYLQEERAARQYRKEYHAALNSLTKAQQKRRNVILGLIAGDDQARDNFGLLNQHKKLTPAKRKKLERELDAQISTSPFVTYVGK